MTQRMIYDIVREPVGNLYRDLLAYALRHCRQFILVPRGAGSLEPEPPVRLALSDLDPFLLKSKLVSEWPGTRLIGHDTEVRWFEYNSSSAQILKTAATHLYQWERPELPEDLCLMRDEESPWLVTIAHERDAYLKLEVSEMSVIASEFPELASICGEPRIPGES